MEFGITLRLRNLPEYWRPWQDLYSDALAIARHAEAVGFESVWVAEHHSVREGYDPAPFVILGALASVTTKIRLGTQPLLLPLYHPVHVVEQVAAIDVLSGGRMSLGIGAGYRMGDFRAFGIDRRERGLRMDEGCELLEKCFTSPEPFSFSGRVFSVSDVDISPKCVQQPRPRMLYSVRTAVSARRAGKWGYGANMLYKQGDAEELYDVYREALEGAGRGEDAGDVTFLYGGFVAQTYGEAAAVIGETRSRGSYDSWMNEAGEMDEGDRRLWSNSAPGGDEPQTPDDLCRELEKILKRCERGSMRLRGISMTPWPEGVSVEDGKRCLDLIGSRVIPEFKAA